MDKLNKENQEWFNQKNHGGFHCYDVEQKLIEMQNKIKQLEKRNEVLNETNRMLQNDVDEFKRNRFIRFNEDECLPWCEDNKDLGNISCPIVISPYELKSFVDGFNKSQQLEQENAELKKYLQKRFEYESELISKERKRWAKEDLDALAQHDKEVAVKAIENLANSLVTGAVANHWCEKEQKGYFWCHDGITNYLEQLKVE